MNAMALQMKQFRMKETAKDDADRVEEHVEAGPVLQAMKNRQIWRLSSKIMMIIPWRPS